MKNLFVLMGLFLSVQVAFAQKSTDDFAGKWESENGEIVEITKNEGVFLGTATKNGKNFVILEDIQFKENKWKGKINNPRKKVTASCELLLESGNKLKIVAKKGAMSKTVYWTKLD